MSLVAAELERRGVSTVVLALLHEVVARVRPPRALWVPFPHGYPLGAPDDRELQRRVMHAAFELLGEPGPPPVLRRLAP